MHLTANVGFGSNYLVIGDGLIGRSNVRDEPIAQGRNRLNKLRHLAVVLERLSKKCNGPGERGLTDVCFRPDCIKQLVFANQPISVVEQES